MKDLFFKILDMSVTASWVILAVMAVRFLLRKAPKKYSYALWVAALFRLLCPVSIQSVVSAFNFAPFHKATLQTTGELQFVPSDVRMVEINTGIPVVDAVINTGAPVVDTAVSAPVPVAPPVVTPAVTVTPMQMLVFIGMAAWVIGMMTMVTISIVNYIKLRKDLRFAVRMRDNIWQCETVRSPFLVGLVKPKIYLPYGLDGQTQEYILAHEQYHLKRLDHIAKLLGYAALTIHWFNPLCHLAFRLMNSDMEMSCDEYVLDRNNIPTTQYSYSLLTIATNRRFPAATPLAFAESGVKERMINVLKWKKPKKWVSVVAVMVCTILLISCATNPKVTIPTGDEPAVEDSQAALLEFPGLKWGMTPEEVKTALELTEEQIVSQKYSEGDENESTCRLSVKNTTFLDEEVSLATFQFSNNGKGYKLHRIDLYLDEDVDMNEMNNALTEVYGEGTGEYYLNYHIDVSGKLQEGKRRGDTELGQQYNMYTRLTEKLSGDMQRKKDAVFGIVEDPEFMVEHWVSSAKGTEVLPEDGQELFVQFFEETEQADRETVMAWFEKVPLVANITQNRSLAAAMHEIDDSPSEESAYVTHNQVIFDAGNLIYFIEGIERLTPVGDPALLELPGMKWGDTPETIKSVLNLPEENYLLDAQLAQTRWLTVVGDFNYFGEEVAYGRFHYTRHLSTQDWALSSVELYYKEDSDMAAVKEELIALYGAPNEGLGFTRYRIYKGEIEEYVDPGFTSNFVDVDEPVFGWWQSETKRAGVLSEEIVDRMVASAIVDTSGLGTGLDPADPASRDVILDYLNKESATLLCCSNNKISRNVMLPQYTTPYAVYFDATTSIWAQSYFQLNQVGYNYVDDKTMLEFPRLKWGASVEEVKTALNIQEEQISTDDFLEATNFDTHLLHVKDITFFGEEVSLGCFKFRSVDEENVGLSYIMLFLDEDTDMEHLQAELSYQYQNQGTGETFDTCQWNIKDKVNYDPEKKDRPGEYELEEGKSRGGDAELWRLVNNPPSGSGYNFYEAALKVVEDPEFKTYNWVSPVKFTEVISSEGQNALKEAYETYSNIDPSLTQKFLENRPTVRMSISNRTWQAARVELEGITEGELTLATHNLVILDAQTLIELQYEAQRLQKVLESE